MSFFDFFQMIGMNLWLYGGTFILTLSILVFVHEWGHYIVARLCGIKVETFSLGFGKELAGFNDRHGTRWKLSLIPLGGYVKLFGDTDPASAGHTDTVSDAESGNVRPLTAAEREEAFFAKPVWKRALVVVAGPAINYIFALILLTALFTLNGQPVTPPVAAAIIGGSSADKYGFEPHDKIISINGKSIETFEAIRQEMMIALDQEKLFEIERDGKRLEIKAKAEKVEREDRFGFRHSTGMLGLISPQHAIDLKTVRRIDRETFAEGETERVAREIDKRMGTLFEIEIQREERKDVYTISPLAARNPDIGKQDAKEYQILFLSSSEAETFRKFPMPIAFVKALQQTRDVTLGTIEAMGQMITGMRSASELGGVIRIGAVAGDMAQQGIIALIMFTALLSINLGLINLFPIPMLDGGHLVFYFFEALLGKPVPDRVQEYAFRAGLFFLVCIMVFANLNDIVQLIL